MGEKPDLGRYLSRLDSTAPAARVSGRVQEVTGLVIRASVPGVTIGEMVKVETSAEPLLAQTVGFKGELAVLMPLGSLEGVGPQSRVTATGEPFRIRCSQALLGRVLDGLGNPIDAKGPLGESGVLWAADQAPPDPMTRPRIEAPFETGIRVVDGLLSLGEGQRIGLFAGSGVGKSFFMGRMARNCAADVVVICLVGERGRELRDFLEDSLGPTGLERSVVVCATSDEPSMVRLKAASVATAIAEYFRDQGQKVLLMMDSVTRLAHAHREVGLAAGEPPVRRGYPPSTFSMLPRLLERTGQASTGSITALYTILIPGDNMNDPIADEVRSILDGHIVLSRALSSRNHWPAVSVLKSLSRLMRAVTSSEHGKAAGAFRQTLATYEAHRDLITLGAYKAGSDPEVDEAIELVADMNDFLVQDLDEDSPIEATIDHLLQLFG